MDTENKTALRTFRFRVKDKQSGKYLAAAARAVNFVWNYCNGAQVHALDHNAKWPSEGQLKSLTAGASKNLGIPGARRVRGVYRPSPWVEEGQAAVARQAFARLVAI